MSYSFQVTFGADGTGTVSGVTGDPPESGHINVNGHGDSVFTNIGAALIDDNGRQLVGGYGAALTIPAPAPAPAEVPDPAPVDPLPVDDGGQGEVPDPAQAVAADANAGGE